METPTAANRLDEAASPYLQLHADNPVNWQPWDDKALAAAQEHDVPIFLSVGYSACHWCHVMEKESFDDETVAATLNESFVPVKVDREERPDIDRIYQTVCQQVSGRGGWPLSVWLTPAGKPFYVGTYFPREARRGMPGFLDVLESIHESWQTERDDILDRADQWAAIARQELESVPDDGATTKPAGNGPATQIEPAAGATETGGSDQLLQAAAAIRRTVDREHGGFGNSGPKFPQPPRVDVLLRAADRLDRGDTTTTDGLSEPDAFRGPARETLDAMAQGGLYDHLGGGFHRYATDREWIVPHFEKMLYDNAELPRVYADAYRQTGDTRYRDIVTETIDFVDAELRHPDGGGYSTLNAQSPIPAERRDGTEPGADEEGAFYVWRPEEVHNAIGDSALASLFCDRYGVTDRGNFEGDTVLTINTSIEALAADRTISSDEVRTRLATAREAAIGHRSNRPRPSRDEKVLGAWNGLFIGAAADAALAIDDLPPAVAVETVEFVREQLWDGDRLARWYKDGAVGGNGYLEDYAFLGRGALRCFEATGNVEHLVFALSLAETIEAAFWDADDRTLYFTPEDGERLIARPQEPIDQSTPSSLGVATQLLSLLDPFVSHDRFHAIATAVVNTYRGTIESSPLQHPTLAICADLVDGGPTEITLAATAPPDEWLSAIGERYLPNRVLAHRPPTASALDGWLDRLGSDDVPPVWADRGADGDATAYLCCDQTCSAPLSDPSALSEWIERLVR